MNCPIWSCRVEVNELADNRYETAMMAENGFVSKRIAQGDGYYRYLDIYVIWSFLTFNAASRNITFGTILGDILLKEMIHAEQFNLHFKYDAKL